jgi:hypothetical protein
MGKFYERLDRSLTRFIRDQKLFFTATAPSDGARINLSPKGYDSFAILDDETVAYYDLPGSGNETANHVEDNGRLTLMWCAFEGNANILRLYCQAEVVTPKDPRFAEMLALYWPQVNPRIVRQVFLGRIESIQTSCGFGVPLFQYVGDREVLVDWAEKQDAQGTLEGYIEKNSVRNDAKHAIRRGER